MTGQRRWGALIVLTLFAVVSVGALSRAPSISDDLEAKAQERFLAEGLDDLSVSFDGRDARVVGSVPEDSPYGGDAATLTEMVRSVTGVRTVDLSGVSGLAGADGATAGVEATATPATTPELEPTAVPAEPDPAPTSAPAMSAESVDVTDILIEFRNGDETRIALTGVVMTEAHRAALGEAAAQTYGAENVVDDLTVTAPELGADAMPETTAQIDELGELIAMTSSLLSGRLGLTGGEFALNAISPSAALADDVRAALASLGSSDITIDLDSGGVLRSLDLTAVQFETGTAILTSQARAALDAAAAQIMQLPADVQLEVAGHTDNRGSAESNQLLSEARAEAVRDHLVASGVDSGQLIATGYGESQPIADNDTAEGRDANRRVELLAQEG